MLFLLIVVPSLTLVNVVLAKSFYPITANLVPYISTTIISVCVDVVQAAATIVSETLNNNEQCSKFNLAKVGFHVIMDSLMQKPA
jgi:hypothetical protein